MNDITSTLEAKAPGVNSCCQLLNSQAGARDWTVFSAHSKSSQTGTISCRVPMRANGSKPQDDN
jgi:hypothetical protein